MQTGDVVRVLEDRYYGHAPIGSIDAQTERFARVAFDEPERWGSLHQWFKLSELEVVDVEAWEKAIRRDVA